MSHPARLSLRAPPHLPFVQGYPGIPPLSASASSSSGRKPAAVHGTLEVRVGTIPVKAKWVRVELRKFESLPPGFPSSSSSSSSSEPVWEHVGPIQTLWQPSQGKEWDSIETADFKFYLPLPEDLPSTIQLQKGSGIRYELVAALCYRQKGGVFKKESAPIVKVSEPLRITKHELHSAWPIYNVPDSRTIQAANGQVNLSVSRPSSAFGAGDHLQLTATLKSARPQPFKLRGFECTLYEVVTAVPLSSDQIHSKSSKKHKSPPAPVSKSRPVASVRVAVDENVGLGGEKSSRIDMPVENVSVSVKSARTIQVAYELEVKAVTDGLPEKVVLGGIRYTVGPFMGSHAQQAVRDIGYVESLCPNQIDPSQSSPSIQSNGTTDANRADGVPPPANNYSPRSSALISHTPSPRPAQGQGQGQGQGPAVQGFIPRDGYRRQSSATSVTTETTATSAAHDFGGYPSQPNGRPYATMPNQQRRPDVAFPSPQPARPRSTDITPGSPVGSLQGTDRFTQSEAGHGDEQSKRYSTGTSATFGRWDGGLRDAMGPGKVENLLSVDESEQSSQVTAKAPSTIRPAQSSTPPTAPAAAAVGGGSSRAGSSRAPPSSYPYPTAEQEKRRQKELYEIARARAASAQQASGASLVRLGMADTPPPSSVNGQDAEDLPPPPEYAPPRPQEPGGRYVPPPKTAQEYTSPTASASAGSSFPSRIDAPDIGANREPNASPSPPPPVPKDKIYMSAAEEKETQRKRYEEATRRVVSGPSGSSSDQAAGPSGATNLAAFASGISVGAISPTEAANDQPVPYDTIYPTSYASASAGPSTPSDSGANGKPGAMSEKEQMKRYYEAQDRVAAQAKRQSGAGGSVDGHGSPTPGPSSSTSRVVSTPTRQYTSAGSPSPMNEKEQMRRFYEAQERVAQAQAAKRSSGGTLGGSLDGHVNAIASSSSMPGSAGRRIDSPVRSSTATPVNEKEQMRRYYEAQDRVAKARQRNSTSTPASPITSISNAQSATASPQAQNTPTFGDATPLGGSVGIPTRTTSAVDEKAQMKRYYEALDAVERARTGQPAQGGSGGAGVGPSSDVVTASTSSQPTSSTRSAGGDTATALAPPIDPPSFEDIVGSSSSSHPNGSSTPTQSGGRYASAQEEKDVMRQRYEAAQQAVQGRGPSSSTSMSDNLSKGEGAERDSFRAAQSPPQSPSSMNSPFIRDPTVKAGKARAATVDSPKSLSSSAFAEAGAGPDDDAPPPPLPARPPREYIHLLSP